MILELDVLQSLFTKSRVDSKRENLITNCPKCGHMEFGISIHRKNNPCQCFRKKHCGWEGNIYSLLKELGRTELLGDRELVPIGETLENKFLESEEKEESIELPNIIPPIGWRRIQFHDYLEKRQFYEYSRYEVGITKLDPKLKNNYLIFLIRQFGEIKGYLGRHLWEKKEIEENNRKFKETGQGKFILRYSNSLSTDFSSLLFGYDEIVENTKTIILVEGIFDKFRVDKLLYLHQQDEIKCVCSFKCHLSSTQKRLLKDKKIDSLILLYDGDVIKDIVSTLNDIRFDFSIIRVGVHPNPKIDPGEFTDLDIELVIDRLQSPSQFLSSFLIPRSL